MSEKTRTRISVLLAVTTAVACSWTLFGDQSAMTAAQGQSNFVGGNPTRPDSSDIRALRIRFEPGSRSNWHSHGNWQIIMAEEGPRPDAGPRRRDRRTAARECRARGTRRRALARRGPGLVHGAADVRERRDELAGAGQRRRLSGAVSRPSFRRAASRSRSSRRARPRRFQPGPPGCSRGLHGTNSTNRSHRPVCPSGRVRQTLRRCSSSCCTCGPCHR